MVLRTFTGNPTSKSGLDCFICAIFARNRVQPQHGDVVVKEGCHRCSSNGGSLQLCRCRAKSKRIACLGLGDFQVKVIIVFPFSLGGGMKVLFDLRRLSLEFCLGRQRSSGGSGIPEIHSVDRPALGFAESATPSWRSVRV